MKCKLFCASLRFMFVIVASGTGRLMCPLLVDSPYNVVCTERLYHTVDLT